MPVNAQVNPLGRLYLVATPREAQREEEFLARVRAALEGGVDTLQLRCKDWEALPYLRLAEKMRALTLEFRTPLIINDRPDVALAAAADGVHLGQHDLPVPWARQIAPQLLIGRSTHAPNQAEAALSEHPAYFAVGPVHATPTKPGRNPVGLEYVRWAATTANVPWYAIGGITLDNAAAVLAAGATRLAVVRAILDAHDVASTAHRFKQLLNTHPSEVTPCK